MNRRSFITNVSALVATSRLSSAMDVPRRYLVMLGTRTNTPGKGIYSFFFDVATGTCTPALLAAELAFPTAFAVSADKKFLYSTSELGNDGKSDGAISAFSIDTSKGKLALLNKVASNGGGPTFLSLDRSGKTVVAACFGGGKVNAFQVLPDGRLGDMTSSAADYGSGVVLPRQANPHVHCVVFSPGMRFVLAADLGADRVFVYRFDQATGKLTANDPPFYQAPAGSGPRQIVFHPNGKFLYLISEMGGQVTALAWGANDGTLTELQKLSCFPSEMTGERSAAGIIMRPDGKFLYTTTRTDSSIEVYAVEPLKGALTLVQRVAADGKFPWSCTVDPTGRFLLAPNQQSNTASIYRIDQTTGRISLLVSVPDIPLPVSAVFLAV